MELFEYFKTIDNLEIEKYISEKQEENLTLEFKTVNYPDYNALNKEFDKKNISKVLSGFANSNGGIVIWGIKASQNSNGQDVAIDKKPINDLTKFLNLLNKLEGQAVTPNINGIIHEKIELDNDIGFIKTFVPPSDIAPHMANFAEKHYYKRSGDSFYQCEHYDIVDMFSRKTYPNLQFSAKILKSERRLNNRIRYVILISISNEGRAIAKYPYLALTITSGFTPDEFGLDGSRSRGLKQIKNNSSFDYNYSGGLDIVIYPKTTLNVDRFCFETEAGITPNNVVINYMLSSENMDTITKKMNISSSDFSI